MGIIFVMFIPLFFIYFLISVRVIETTPHSSLVINHTQEEQKERIKFVYVSIRD